MLVVRAGELLRTDTAKAFALIARAARLAPKSSGILMEASRYLIGRNLRDGGYALARTALTPDPRSLRRTNDLMWIADSLGKLNDVFAYASNLVALDSADQRGWVARMTVSKSRGDTAAIRKDVQTAMQQSRDVGPMLLQFMIGGGIESNRRFLALSSHELGIREFVDSANSHFNNKIFVAVRLRDSVRARSYADSLRKLLSERTQRGSTTGSACRRTGHRWRSRSK